MERKMAALARTLDATPDPELMRSLYPKTRTIEVYGDTAADARATAESYGYRVRRVETSRKWAVTVYAHTCEAEPLVECLACKITVQS